MEDNVKKPELEGPVRVSDVQLLDESSLTKNVCPVCASVDWYIIQNAEHRNIAVIPMGNEDGSTMILGGVPAVTLTCSRCGYIRQHVKSLFDAHVASIRNKKNGDG